MGAACASVGTRIAVGSKQDTAENPSKTTVSYACGQALHLLSTIFQLVGSLRAHYNYIAKRSSLCDLSTVRS